MSTFSRIRFYFEQQQHLCALRIVEQCKNRGGLMTLRPKKQNTRVDYDHTTWDHVYPREHRTQPGDGDLVLLACSQCNNARGSRPPTAAYIARGMTLLAEWSAYAEKHHSERHNAREARRQQRTAHRRLVRAILTGDDLLLDAIKHKRPFSLIASKTSQKKKRNAGLPKVEDPAPRTVAEAVAMGGAVARKPKPKPIERHPHLPAAGYSLSTTEKERRRRNIESEIAAARGIMARAQQKGGKANQTAENMRRKIERLERELSQGPSR